MTTLAIPFSLPHRIARSVTSLFHGMKRRDALAELAA